MSARLADRQLLSACTRGDAGAWHALVDRYGRLVYSIALRAGLSQQDAEDVLQTTFARLLEHLHRLRDPDRLAAWLITTAKRASWRAARLRRREPASEKLTDDEGWLLGAGPDDELWIDQALVRDALARLRERCRRLLWALYYDPTEPPYGVISQEMGMPLGSIGPTRARCLAQMREILDEMGMRA